MENYKEESKIQKIIGIIEKAIEEGKIEDVIVQKSNVGINYAIIEKKIILRVENLTIEEEKKLEDLSTRARIGAGVRERIIINKNNKYNDWLEQFTVPDEYPNTKGISYTEEDLDKLAEAHEIPNIKQSPKKTTKKRYKSNKIKVEIKELLNKIECIPCNEKQKEKIKEMLRDAILNGKRYIAIGIATLIALFGVIYISEQKDEEVKTGEETTYQTDETTYKIEETTSENKPEVNPTDTIEEVKADFVKKYLEAYNETYGTEYTKADLLTSFMNGIEIFELEDGRKVTKGNYPYETKNALEQIGEYKAGTMRGDLVQIVLPNGKILGSYNTITGEFMYSGNQVEDLITENFDEPTLEKLGINPEKLEAVAKVNMAQYGEDKRSITLRIDDYNDTDIEPEK